MAPFGGSASGAFAQPPMAGLKTPWRSGMADARLLLRSWMDWSPSAPDGVGFEFSSGVFRERPLRRRDASPGSLCPAVCCVRRLFTADRAPSLPVRKCTTSRTTPATTTSGMPSGRILMVHVPCRISFASSTVIPPLRMLSKQMSRCVRRSSRRNRGNTLEATKFRRRIASPPWVTVRVTVRLGLRLLSVTYGYGHARRPGLVC